MVLRETGHCHLLEPFYEYTLSLPDDYVGRAMTDINRMYGTAGIAENDHENKITVLTGRAPVSAMNGYVKEVTAYTRGQGQLSLSLCGYDNCHNEEEVLASGRYDPDSDLRNPASSVFCSHGAGSVIAWDEVEDYMHLSYASRDGAMGTTEDGEITDISENEAARENYLANVQRIRRNAEDDTFISVEEVDSILKRNSYANENGRSGSYKGISSDRARRHASSGNQGKVPVYKGSIQKPKYNLVDGYNVIHAWSELNELAAVTIDGAAARLNDILCNYQAITKVPLMVVYDAYKVKGHATSEKQFNNINIVYTKETQTADQYIERYAHDNSHKYDITVVTSDGIEQVIVMGNGCNIMSSRELQEEISIRTKAFNEQFKVK